MLRLNGYIKWYNNKKHYGYIIGNDNEQYFFESIFSQQDQYQPHDLVSFIPFFNTINYAKAVQLVKGDVNEKR